MMPSKIINPRLIRALLGRTVNGVYLFTLHALAGWPSRLPTGILCRQI